MIRFMPDTWRDALGRPLAMAAPDAGVYVEIMAPDVRFSALLALTLITLGVAWRRRERLGSLALLLAFVWMAFAAWLATSGNGRYFMAVLLVAGPLCIALIYRLPASTRFRMALSLILLATQLTVVATADPRRKWSLMPWGEPYFTMELTDADRHQPAVWVMITSLSYSLVAPQFDPRSRWMNLSGLHGFGTSQEDQRAQFFLASAVRDGLPLQLLVPANPNHADDSGLPSGRMLEEIERTLGPHRLGLAGACEQRLSQTMRQQVGAHTSSANGRLLERAGFWVCPLKFPVDVPAPMAMTPGEQLAARVFERLEQQCPRLFTPGEGRTARLPDGFVRNYLGADMRAYVTDGGQVSFKYWRALSPNQVGTIDEVLSPDFLLDCHQVRGRSGLPWERRL